MQQASNPLNDKPHGALLALRFGAFELDPRAGEMRSEGGLGTAPEESAVKEHRR